ncbi:multidrug transporter subunit MdtN [Hafnia alvei]|uniref:multidrug transporter subunit MdtN n=1 Tax=Hafnia alvei TaxID=569 RepID=UPI0010406CC8|nr:multidrug transporter subunit MdtN [Hafnia alvei]QBJ34623.1 multidrug transporter subunit MdtN [Hafnia alvei]
MFLKNKFYIFFLILITLIALCIVMLKIDEAPQTDDAYIYADTINVVPVIEGHIVTIPVKNNQLVTKGDLLFKIDPRPYEHAIESGTAQLATLDEQIKLAQRAVDAQQYSAQAAAAKEASAKENYQQALNTYQRISALKDKGFVSVDEFEQARTAKNSAEAMYKASRSEVEQAKSAVSSVDALIAQRKVVYVDIAKARLNLEYSEIRAPFDGRVTSLNTTIGQYASPQQSVMTLIDTQAWYVVANFRETDLKNVCNGIPARIFVMGDTRKSFTGSVDSIGYGVSPQDSGTSNGLPSVARTINWVHVSQRFPVKIRVDNPEPALFRVGASAIAIVYRDTAP